MPCKIYTLLLFVVTMLFSQGLFSQEKESQKRELVIAIDQNHAPFAFYEFKKFKGIYTEIARKIFSQMKDYRIKLTPMPWKRSVQLAKRGKVFGLIPPYYRPIERPFIWPYSLPIYQEEIIIFCRDDVASKLPNKSRWPEDFKGLIIGNNLGYANGGPAFREMVKDKTIFLDEARTPTQNISKLLKKRIDCYMHDRLAILWHYNKLKLKKKNKDKTISYLTKTPWPKLEEVKIIHTDPVFLGLSNHETFSEDLRTKFVKEFNTLLHKMMRSRDIEKIINSYIETD